MKAASIMALAVAVGLVLGQTASGSTLLVADGETLPLGGEHTFDAVEIHGTLQLTGDTDLTVLDYFFLGLMGRVDGAGAASANGWDGFPGEPEPTDDGPIPGVPGEYGGDAASPAERGREFIVRAWNDLTVLGTIDVAGGLGGYGGNGGNGTWGGSGYATWPRGESGGLGGGGGQGADGGDGGRVLLASHSGTITIGAAAAISTTGGGAGRGGAGGDGGDGGDAYGSNVGGDGGNGGDGGSGADGGSGGLIVLMAPDHAIDPTALLAFPGADGADGGPAGHGGDKGLSADDWYSGTRGLSGAPGGAGAAGFDGAVHVFATPEPATLALLAVGGLSLVLRRRRK